MGEVEIVVALLACAALLTITGRRTGVPYPIVLVCGGLALAVLPGLPALELGPELVFEERSSDYQRLMHELLAAQRTAAYEIRSSGAIGDETMLAIQRDLDLEQARRDAAG